MHTPVYVNQATAQPAVVQSPYHTIPISTYSTPLEKPSHQTVPTYTITHAAPSYSHSRTSSVQSTPQSSPRPDSYISMSPRPDSYLSNSPRISHSSRSSSPDAQKKTVSFAAEPEYQPSSSSNRCSHGHRRSGSSSSSSSSTSYHREYVSSRGMSYYRTEADVREKFEDMGRGRSSSGSGRPQGLAVCMVERNDSHGGSSDRRRKERDGRY